MEPIVVATWGLVVVTILLVVATFTGIARAEGHAKAQRAELAEQTTALVDAARANQAMADEMREARRAARPLGLEVELADDARGGIFTGRVVRDGPLGIVLERAELLVGRDRVAAAEPLEYANFYLGGSNNQVSVHMPFDPQGRDLLILRLTGIPENGLEQSMEFHYRIQPTGKFERLSTPLASPPLIAWG